MAYDQKSSPEYYSDLIVRVFDRQFIYDNAIEEVKSSQMNCLNKTLYQIQWS